MPLTRIVASVLREVWDQTTPQDGNTIQTIETGIRCHEASLARVRARLIIGDIVGTPEISTVSSVNNGFLVLTVTNSADAGNTATWTVDVQFTHSMQQARSSATPVVAPPTMLAFGSGGMASLTSMIAMYRSLRIVTPEMFRAGGLGVTDDTAAIQAACDSFGGESGVVYFPGRYLISSVITVPSRVTVCGPATLLSSSGIAEPVATGGGVLLCNNYANFSFLRLSSYSAVANLVFDAPDAAPVLTGGRVIDISDSVNVRLDGITVMRAYDSIAIVNAAHNLNACYLNTIQLYNTTRYAIHLEHAVGIYVNGFLISNPNYIGTSYGFYFVQSTATVQITNGTMWGLGQLCWIQGGALGSMYTEADDIHFSQFDLDNAVVGSCVYAENVTNFTMNGLWIGHAAASDGVQLYSGEGIHIHDCSVLDHYYGGISVFSGAAGVHIKNNTIVANNRSNNPSGDGVHVGNGASRIYIQGNRISNTQAYLTIVGYQRYGVRYGESPNAQNQYIIKDNDLVGNVTAGLLDNGTGVNKIVTPNLL